MGKYAHEEAWIDREQEAGDILIAAMWPSFSVWEIADSLSKLIRRRVHAREIWSAKQRIDRIARERTKEGPAPP